MSRRDGAAVLARGALAVWLCTGVTRAADVAVLAQELGAPNVVVRRDAAFSLSRMGAPAKEALPALIRALDDNDKQVWSLSIATIASLGPEAKDAIPALIDALGSRKSRGRDRERRQAVTRAAFALSRIGAAAIPPLIEALKSDDNSQRGGAAKALAGMGAEAGPAVSALIVNLQGEDEVRIETAEALGAIGGSAVPALIDALKSQDARERAGAAMAIAAAGVSAKASAAALFDLSKTENEPAARAAIFSALPKIGADPREVVPLLVEGVKADDETVRHAAINALIPMRGARELALAGLGPLLQDENAAFRQRAARALGRMGPGAAPVVPALIEAARKSPGDASIANALAEIGPVALPAILTVLRDAPEPDAERLLGLLRGFGAPAVPVLIEALKHSAPNVRASAARTLGGMGRDAKAALEPLFAMSTDAETLPRAAALRALVGLEADGQKLKPMLEAALKDAAPEVRRAGAAGLARSGGPNELGVAGLVELLDDENSASRRSAIEGLGGMGAAAASALPALIERLTDADLQIPAITAIGKIGPAAAPAVPRLIELGKSGPLSARVAAFAALAGIGREASVALPAIYDALKGDESNEGDVRAAVIPALVAIESDESKIIATLVEAVGNESSRVRRPAAAALSKFGERARAAAPALITMLERNNERGVALLSLKLIGVRSVPDLLRALNVGEPQVRVFVCEQLAAMGTEAKDASARLRELTVGQPKAVEEAAKAALAKIESAPGS